MPSQHHQQINTRKVSCQPRVGGFLVSFHAMASQCELLVDCDDQTLAQHLGKIAATEAWRIEDKYSRYQQNSVCGQLNRHAGKPCKIDQETLLLLNFAEQCYQLSDGLFDLTSGVLRKAWHFDGSDNVPNQTDVDALLPFIGWSKVNINKQLLEFTMLKSMEIDFGGIGKEYAVDRTVLLLSQWLSENLLAKANSNKTIPFLVNYGGDLAVNGARANNQAWQIGVERSGLNQTNTTMVTMREGAVATSGDAHRFLLKNGHRYSHVLNVKTGWPVENPPSAITVAAPKCIQAGFLATLALLQGKEAEQFLTEQDIKFWAIRPD